MSLIYHLYSNKLIDYPIVSLYLPGKSSLKDDDMSFLEPYPSIKFGSYDQFALEDIEDFYELQTNDLKTWSVIGSKLKVNDIVV